MGSGVWGCLCVSESIRALYIGARHIEVRVKEASGGPVVHRDSLLALFRICSSYERNIRQHHDISDTSKSRSEQRK